MIRYSTALRNKLLTTAADGGLSLSEIFADATLKFYSAVQPVDPDAAMPGDLICTITGLSFTAATSGAISKPSGTTWSGAVATTGTPQSFRLEAATGESLDGEVGPEGELQFLNYQWESGQTKTIMSMSLTMPVSATSGGGGGAGDITGISGGDNTLRITCGPGGDFALLKDAIQFAMQHIPANLMRCGVYPTGDGWIELLPWEPGVYQCHPLPMCRIVVLNDFVFAETIIVPQYTNLGWIDIVTEQYDEWLLGGAATTSVWHEFNAVNEINAPMEYPYEESSIFRILDGATGPTIRHVKFRPAAGSIQRVVILEDGASISLHQVAVAVGAAFDWPYGYLLRGRSNLRLHGGYVDTKTAAIEGSEYTIGIGRVDIYRGSDYGIAGSPFEHQALTLVRGDFGGVNRIYGPSLDISFHADGGTIEGSINVRSVSVFAYSASPIIVEGDLTIGSGNSLLTRIQMDGVLSDGKITVNGGTADIGYTSAVGGIVAKRGATVHLSNCDMSDGTTPADTDIAVDGGIIHIGAAVTGGYGTSNTITDSGIIIGPAWVAP